MSTDVPSDGAQHAGGHGGGPEQLVKMANDIGDFFRAGSDRGDAIAQIANHIDKFWTKRMREKLQMYLHRGGAIELDDLPREALKRLFAPGVSAAHVAPAALPIPVTPAIPE